MSQNPPTNAVVINMNGTAATTPNPPTKDKDALFGPSIGPVSSGPAWTNLSEKKVLTDELTPEVIRGWIEKSKEPSHPTTTLQALVNLKRPTLRLSPLSSAQDDEHHHHYGLEYEYDCDAPKCGLYVHVLLSKDHPDAPATSYSNGLSKLLVFESVVDGGFGKILKVEDGATLELGRFERIPKIATENANNNTPQASGPTAASSETTVADSSAAASNAASDTATNNNSNRHSRRRFTHFHFRKRSQNRSVSGPALAVVDAEPTPATDAVKTKDGKEDDAEGIRVIIRLAALDEQGTELASPNEQLTYLHIVRFGAKPIPEEGSSEEVEDTRSWVVKVVKREATIGPHTFHLHEIYGLSSSSTSTHPPAPTTPLPSTPTAHTYPPQNAAVPAPPADDEPSSECLLCLSSPREVVLLPCRHLVACKECALNMVEFGAGGAITQVEEPVAPPPAATPAAETNGDAANAENPSADGSPPPPTPAPVAPPVTNTRRKRRAKGWFCPVCRQPYSSLLRITANAPPHPADDDKEDDTQEGEPTNANGVTAEARNGGLLASAFGTSFLRNLSFSRPGTANPGDIESQTAPVTRVGA